MNTLKSFVNKLCLKEKPLAFAYALTFIMLLVFTVSSYTWSYEKGGFDKRAFVALSRDWTQVLPDGQELPIQSLPVDLGDEVGEEIVIRRRLPSLFLTNSPALFIKSNHQTVSARVDGEAFFYYQFWASRHYDVNFPPSQWLIIPLPNEYAGAEIELSLTRLQNDRTDTVSEIFLGDRADIIFLLIRKNVLPLTLGVIPFLMGLLFLARQLFSPTRKDLGYRNLYIGLILVLLPLWMFCNSDIRQVFFTNILYVRNMEFLTLMMLPTPVILSLNYTEGGRFRTVAYALCAAIFLIDLTVLNLVLWGPYNLLNLLWLILLTLGIAAAFILVSFWRIAVTDVELLHSLRTVWYSYGLLLLLIVGEYLDMTILHDRHRGVCLSVGVLAYAIGLSVEQSRSQRRMVTQMQRAEMQSRAKSEFLASMSHEIRTPINAVLGMDEMILREATDPAVLSYAADIQHAGKHLLSLINDILDISRIESGHMEIVEDSYDLDVLLTDIADLIRVQAEEKGLAFEMRILSVMPSRLYGDAARIRQVAINLLNNAVKYTRSGSVVFSVDTVSEEEMEVLRTEAVIVGPPADVSSPVYLRLSVRDTGIGIRQENLAVIFDSFARFDLKENAGIQGTGLGLPIVSTLVQLMHGCLLVKSVYGIGSQFTVIVPQEKQSSNWFGAVPSRARKAGVPKPDKAMFHAPEASVLAVDDNVLNRRLLTALLRRTKVRLTTCESGQECLKLVQNEHFDLILMDHLMPEMDGIETLRRMRVLPESKCAGVPVIVLTANAIDGVRETYLAAGFDDYLSKPVQSAELEQMLMRYLPPEKLLHEDDANAPQPTPAKELPLPDWLYQVEELDVPLGIKYCGTPETYLDTLSIYAKNADDLAGEIEALRRADDVAGTVVKVHALKSTSLAVGALGLSALAERLETAGKSGDTQTLDAELDGLLSRCRLLCRQLSPLLKEEEPPDDAPPDIPEARLKKTYDMIRALLDDFEYERAAGMIDSLDGLRLPDGERERVDRMKRAAESFDWDEIGGILT